MEVLNRVKAKTPSFFKKVRKFAVILSVVATSIIGAQKSGEIDFPDFIYQISKYIAFMAATAAVIAQTTKED